VFKTIVYPVFENSRVKRFLVISNENSYSVRFDKVKEIWTCSCPNIRNSECKHIRECKNEIK